MSFLSAPSLPPTPKIPRLPAVPKVSVAPSRKGEGDDSLRIAKQDEALRRRLSGKGRARTILGGQSGDESGLRRKTLLGE